MDFLSITDDKGVEHKFEVPGFECELLAVGKIRIYGFAYSEDENMTIPCSWFYSGVISEGYSSMSLTPIKKELYGNTWDNPSWYECPENFPCIISNNDFTKSKVIMHKNYDQSGWINLLSQGWRLATEEEVMSLYWKDK